MITFQNIDDILQGLAKQRPLFHSEADFQHALAWYVHKMDQDITVRLELPFRSNGLSEYLDLFLSKGNQSIAVELKYKTRKFAFHHDAEHFNLKQQGAQDIGRYDFLADVERLERFVAEGRAATGCAILLTNDSSYWSNPIRAGTVDEKFRLTEGREVQGSLDWLKHASEGTMRGRKDTIHLKGVYTANWKVYPNHCDLPGGEFRYLTWLITTE